jgi:hypothetical protein
MDESTKSMIAAYIAASRKTSKGGRNQPPEKKRVYRQTG